MNERQYTKWKSDAAFALSGKYKEDEINIILDWFEDLDHNHEIKLIGKTGYEAMLLFVNAKAPYDMYNSLMSRIFIYAPLILIDYQRNHAPWQA